MPFTDEERQAWHTDKMRREAEKPMRRPNPVAICIHCNNPFGSREGTITPEVAICDICNGD